MVKSGATRLSVFSLTSILSWLNRERKSRLMSLPEFLIDFQRHCRFGFILTMISFPVSGEIIIIFAIRKRITQLMGISIL